MLTDVHLACEHLASSLKLKVADNWYRIILVLVFLLEVLACSLVPIIGQPLSFVLLCWLYAYYSFEYAGPQGQACSGRPRRSLPLRLRTGCGAAEQVQLAALELGRAAVLRIL